MGEGKPALDAAGTRRGLRAMRQAPLVAAARAASAVGTNCCRCCGALLVEPVLDLGPQPLSDALCDPQPPGMMEPHWPLQALACVECGLMQLADGDAPTAEAAEDRWSRDAWLRQAEALVRQLGLDEETPVLHVGSGDGRRLQPFQRRGIPVLGIEPRASLARQALARGIPTEPPAFSASLARRLRATGQAPALILASDLLAEASDPHDLVAGFRILLAPGGLLLAEVPHLLPVLTEVRLEAIRHGRRTLFSLMAFEMLLAQHDLVVLEAKEAAGGVLRVLACHAEDRGKLTGTSVVELRRRERGAGIDRVHAYRDFAARAVEAKCALLDLLVAACRAGQRVGGWGAGPEAVALANACGLRSDLLPWVVDPQPQRQGRLLPGSGIPVLAPSAVPEARPDLLLILSRTPREEVARAVPAMREWGGRFVCPLPTLSII